MDPGRMVICILLPALGGVARNCVRGQEAEDLTTAALALRVYRIDHGSYPDTLAALGLSADRATDRFSDRPLIYLKAGAGYVLYSVGPDGADDGGKTREEAEGTAHWDIVVKAEK